MDDRPRTECTTARLLPELRRAAVIAVVGLLVALVAANVLAIPPMTLAKRVVGFVVWTIAAGGLLWTAFGFRIEVDAERIRRRRLFLIDEWRRADFQSGVIRRRSGTRFEDPTRPWWRRVMSIASIEASSVDAICERLRAWIPHTGDAPLPPELTAELWRRRIRFERTGVRYGRGPHEMGPLHRWAEIGRITLTRDRHDTVALQTLTFRLTGLRGEVRLAHYHEQPVWRGPDAETLARFIEIHVPAEHLLVIARGRPRSEAERAYRLARCDRSLHTTGRLLFIGCPIAFLTIAVLLSTSPAAGTAVPAGWLVGTLVSALYVTPLAALLAHARHQARASRAELLARPSEQSSQVSKPPCSKGNALESPLSPAKAGEMSPEATEGASANDL
jgi:hypothetical protein